MSDNSHNYSMQQLTHQLYQLNLPTPFQVGDVNLYLLKGESITLIDTGVHTEEAWQLLLEGLDSIGLKLEDISQVLLTHHHLDHIGQANQIKARAGCQLIAHPAAKPFMLQEQAFVSAIRKHKRELYLAHGVPEEDLEKYLKLTPNTLSVQPDIYVQEGDTLPGHPEWKIVETFGHAIGHISLYHERDQILLAGDHLIKHISANAIVEFVHEVNEFVRTRSLPLYREALLKCLELPISTAYSGHGEPITDVPQVINRQLGKQESRAQKIYELIQSGHKTTYAIIQALFPHKYKSQFSLVFSEVLGHLDMLEDQHRINSAKVEDKVYYSLNEDSSSS